MQPQNSPEERINQDPEEGQLAEREIPPSTRRVSLLLSLDLRPSCVTDRWPTHILFADSRYAGALWGLLDNWIGNGTATSPEERRNLDVEIGQSQSLSVLSPLEHGMPVEAIEPDYFVIEEEGGKANLYEVNDHFGSKLLVQEYPDRAAAQEYVDYQHKMDEVAEKISEDYEAMVAEWITVMAAETGLEPRLVREFIGGIID